MLWLSLLVGCKDQTLSNHESEPEAEITSHADGDVVDEGVVTTVSGSVHSDAVVETDLDVTWLLETEVVCEAAAEADGSTQCDFSFTPEAHTVVLEVRDPSNNVASAQVTLVVNPENQAPTCGGDLRGAHRRRCDRQPGDAGSVRAAVDACIVVYRGAVI